MSTDPQSHLGVQSRHFSEPPRDSEFVRRSVRPVGDAQDQARAYSWKRCLYTRQYAGEEQKEKASRRGFR